MSEWIIRTGRVDEVAQVLELWQVAAENTDRPTDRPEALRGLLERDPEALLVAAEGDRLVGTVIAGWDGWRAHLYRLTVLPERRRRGSAKALLEAAPARLVALGAVRLDAMVLQGNDHGRRLWSSLGYSRQTNWRRWVHEVGG